MGILAADFDFVSSIVRSDAAIVLEKGKEYLVEARLTPLAKESGYETLESLVAVLRSGSAPGLRAKAVEALTTNETSFFRDIEPFEALKNTIIPDLIERRKAAKSLNIWCAASSTGQEPYSLAMLLRESFPILSTWKVSIVATDLSLEVLARARAGKFTQLEVNRGLPVAYLVKYFKKEGTDWIIREDIAKMVSFSQLNLIKPFTLVRDVDLVMIRNVLIYFDVATKREILGKIRKVLKPDGFMFLGAAETTLNIDDNFERRAVGRGSCYALRETKIK